MKSDIEIEEFMLQQPTIQWKSRLPVVLVIDDNSAIRDMVSWALELDGFDTAEASEGQEALDWIRNSVHEGRYPSVVLLDLAMPGMDGYVFLTRLREQWHSMNIPYPLPSVIVVTANHLCPDASTLGVERVIVKPFHVRDLLDIIRGLA